MEQIFLELHLQEIFILLLIHKMIMSIDLSLKEVKRQTYVAAGESQTAGFELIDLMVSKSFSLNSDNDLTLSFFGSNLTDEIARNHASYVKNEVPLAGRNLGIEIRFKFINYSYRISFIKHIE